jgi:hypothetical protein
VDVALDLAKTGSFSDRTASDSPNERSE